MGLFGFIPSAAIRFINEKFYLQEFLFFGVALSLAMGFFRRAHFLVSISENLRGGSNGHERQVYRL